LRENCGASEKEKKKEQLSSVKCQVSSVKEKVRSHLEEIVKAFAYCDIDEQKSLLYKQRDSQRRVAESGEQHSSASCQVQHKM
jgi:hypothetical protein